MWPVCKKEYWLRESCKMAPPPLLRHDFTFLSNRGGRVR